MTTVSSAPVAKRQFVDIAGHEHETRIVSPALGGFLQQRAAVVEKDDLLVPRIQIGQTAKTGADLRNAHAAFGQQLVQRKTLGRVLVLATLPFPKLGTIPAAFVIDNGRRRSRRAF